MGIGLVIATTAMISTGVVEFEILKFAEEGGCRGCKGGSSLSILWQIPQYTLVGASEVFMYVGQLEFFNEQAPNGLKTFGSALCMTFMLMGNYVSSLIVTLVMKITTRENKLGWIPEDLNKGRISWTAIFGERLLKGNLIPTWMLTMGGPNYLHILG